MRWDWQHDPNAPRCRVIDLDTGKQIVACTMADEETGEYVQYVREAERFVIDPETKRVKIISGKARLQIVLLAADEPYLAEAG